MKSQDKQKHLIHCSSHMSLYSQEDFRKNKKLNQPGGKNELEKHNSWQWAKHVKCYLFQA